MRVRLRKFSYRFAEQVLNRKLYIKQEIEDMLMSPKIDVSTLSRPNFNNILLDLFTSRE